MLGAVRVPHGRERPGGPLERPAPAVNPYRASAGTLAPVASTPAGSGGSAGPAPFGAFPVRGVREEPLPDTRARVPGRASAVRTLAAGPLAVSVCTLLPMTPFQTRPRGEPVTGPAPGIAMLDRVLRPLRASALRRSWRDQPTIIERSATMSCTDAPAAVGRTGAPRVRRGTEETESTRAPGDGPGSRERGKCSSAGTPGASTGVAIVPHQDRPALPGRAQGSIDERRQKSAHP